MDMKNGQLIIKSFNENDYGVYECIFVYEAYNNQTKRYAMKSFNLTKEANLDIIVDKFSTSTLPLDSSASSELSSITVAETSTISNFSSFNFTDSFIDFENTTAEPSQIKYNETESESDFTEPTLNSTFANITESITVQNTTPEPVRSESITSAEPETPHTRK